MQKEYTRLCGEYEKLFKFIEQQVDGPINTAPPEEVIPVDVNAKPGAKKEQAKASKGKPGKDEVGSYESPLEQAPGKIDTLVIMMDPKLFDYPLENLNVFRFIKCMSRDFSMQLYVRRLRNVGFQAALNNSQKGIDKDKIKYVTYDFKTEEPDINYDEFNLSKTLQGIQKSLPPQFKLEGVMIFIKVRHSHPRDLPVWVSCKSMHRLDQHCCTMGHLGY